MCEGALQPQRHAARARWADWLPKIPGPVRVAPAQPGTIQPSATAGDARPKRFPPPFCPRSPSAAGKDPESAHNWRCFATTAAVGSSPRDSAFGDVVRGRHGRTGGAGGAAPARPGDRAAVPGAFVGRERPCQERLRANFTRSSGTRGACRTLRASGSGARRAPGTASAGRAYLISTEAPASSS